MANVEEMIRQLAANRCEYCRMPDGVMKFPHVLDHIIAYQHGGPPTFSNYALCCGDCNRHKGPNISGVDPVTGQTASLFHPRRDTWQDHLQWRGPFLIGITPVGRATVAVLAINLSIRVAVRRALIEEGLFSLSE